MGLTTKLITGPSRFSVSKDYTTLSFNRKAFQELFEEITACTTCAEWVKNINHDKYFSNQAEGEAMRIIHKQYPDLLKNVNVDHMKRLKNILKEIKNDKDFFKTQTHIHTLAFVKSFNKLAKRADVKLDLVMLCSMMNSVKGFIRFSELGILKTVS